MRVIEITQSTEMHELKEQVRVILWTTQASYDSNQLTRTAVVSLEND